MKNIDNIKLVRNCNISNILSKWVQYNCKFYKNIIIGTITKTCIIITFFKPTLLVTLLDYIIPHRDGRVNEDSIIFGHVIVTYIIVWHLETKYL